MAITYRPAAVESSHKKIYISAVYVNTDGIESIKCRNLKFNFPKDKNMELIVYYKNFLELCKDDVYTLFYFWEPEIIRTWRNSGIEYERTWCQEALDFAYRVIKIGLMGIDYPESDPTQEEIDYIFMQMSQNSPNNIDGFAIWSSYQLYLSEAGIEFIKKYGSSKLNNNFNETLFNMLDMNQVGFDRHGFFPITF